MPKVYRRGANKNNVAKMIDRYIQGLAAGLPVGDPFLNCNKCEPDILKTNQPTNTIFQSENMRIASALSNNLGGRLTYGNLNTPLELTYLGGVEGQPGGLPRPLRNKF